jgi:Asp-tRNA(Asn)/Glu-tRNA(Gln) amidotransferase A subunit family amidase
LAETWEAKDAGIADLKKERAAERERDAANSLIQEIGMMLGSTDEWSDQENMIADVRQRVNDALAALRTAEGALDEIEISDADADGIFWLKIRLPSGSGGAVNLGNEKRIVAQVGMRFEEERRAALAEIRKALEGK